MRRLEALGPALRSAAADNASNMQRHLASQRALRAARVEAGEQWGAAAARRPAALPALLLRAGPVSVTSRRASTRPGHQTLRNIGNAEVVRGGERRLRAGSPCGSASAGPAALLTGGAVGSELVAMRRAVLKRSRPGRARVRPGAAALAGAEPPPRRDRAREAAARQRSGQAGVAATTKGMA